MRKINKIIIHCSATPDGMDFTVKQIDQTHRKRGFRCIGYHYVIYRDGSVHVGRPLEHAGAHTSGHNANSIGICYIGGCDVKTNPKWNRTAKDTRTPEQRKALVALVKELKTKFPSATIHGHNEFANKGCPSFNVKTDPDLCAL